MIVVTLDGRTVGPEDPIVGVDDPMVARGDGVFETLLVRDGRPCLLPAHLDRMARSAAMVGLPEPDLPQWQAAVATACARGSEQGSEDGDAVLRMVLGRRIGFVTVSELPDRVLVSRRHGVSAMTLDRGVPATSGPAAPWSIAGAKSLSYAVNAAALRHAERRGVDDVVLVSTDGFVLEGPRSSVVIVDGDGALATPPATLPILPGCTVRAMFYAARAHGLNCAERLLRVSDLVAAQGVWLLSSVTLAARVHTLDGDTLPSAPGTVDVAALVDEAMAGPP